MQLIFVHGYSVTNTDTYGDLPQVLHRAAPNFNLNLDIQHIYLGKYISFHDEVMMDDIARAMQQALQDLPGNNALTIKPFSCITHSTGGPVVRSWMDKYFGKDNLGDIPLKHLVMLAPANHGSTLAKLGKARIGRIKAWFSGIEPGQKVLDWLCLGSDGQWNLNQNFTQYKYGQTELYPFVLTGEGIDEKFYDFLNSYLVEKGSDGVIRVSGANMNYRYFTLVQNRDVIIRKRPLTYQLVSEGNIKQPEKMALGVYKDYSHSGKRMGIMRSIKPDETDAPVVQDILKCFQVNSQTDYETRARELEQLTLANQVSSRRYCMLVISIRDDHGEQIGKDDYDLFLLAGKNYDANQLPQGFLLDRQMNDKTGRLIYYLDANKMNSIKDGKFGLRIAARPSKGFSYYVAAEYHSDDIPVTDILIPNQTTYVEVILHRFVDKNVFRFGPVTKKPVNFKRTQPSGDAV